MPVSRCQKTGEKGKFLMGLTYAKVTLKNPRQPDLAAVEVSVLADSAAVHLCIPVQIQSQLGLEEVGKKEATLADGSKKLVSRQTSIDG
jgi:hypothetical protein